MEISSVKEFVASKKGLMLLAGGLAIGALFFLRRSSAPTRLLAKNGQRAPMLEPGIDRVAAEKAVRSVGVATWT